MAKYIERYKLIVRKGNDCYFIPMKNSKGEIKEKTIIEKIDYVTSGYQNLTEFLLDLKRQNVLTINPDEIYIQYNANGSIQKTDLIFDSELIRKCAIENLNKKINGAKQILDRTEELDNYIKKIKFYIINENSYNSMMRSKIVPYQLKNYIKQYVEIDKKRVFTPTEQEDKKEIMSFIEYQLLNYSNLRKVVLWEKKYLYNLEKIKMKNPNLENQIRLVDYYENVFEEKELHDEYEKNIEENYETLEKIEQDSKMKSEEIHNGIYLEDQMLKQIILENFSIEEINNDPNISDKIIELLGINKVKSLSDEELYSLGFDITKFRNEYCEEDDIIGRR